MTNKLVVIIKSLNVPKIKKMLLYEMKFLVTNYSCLRNPWLGGYHPQIPFLSVINWICWTPPPWTKFLGTPLHIYIKGNLKCKVLLVCSIKEYMMSRGIRPLILNFGTGWKWEIIFTLFSGERNTCAHSTFFKYNLV